MIQKKPKTYSYYLWVDETGDVVFPRKGKDGKYLNWQESNDFWGINSHKMATYSQAFRKGWFRTFLTPSEIYFNGFVGNKEETLKHQAQKLKQAYQKISEEIKKGNFPGITTVPDIITAYEYVNRSHTNLSKYFFDTFIKEFSSKQMSPNLTEAQKNAGSVIKPRMKINEDYSLNIYAAWITEKGNLVLPAKDIKTDTYLEWETVGHEKLLRKFNLTRDDAFEKGWVRVIIFEGNIDFELLIDWLTTDETSQPFFWENVYERMKNAYKQIESLIVEGKFGNFPLPEIIGVDGYFAFYHKSFTVDAFLRGAYSEELKTMAEKNDKLKKRPPAKTPAKKKIVEKIVVEAMDNDTIFLDLYGWVNPDTKHIFASINEPHRNQARQELGVGTYEAAFDKGYFRFMIEHSLVDGDIIDTKLYLEHVYDKKLSLNEYAKKITKCIPIIEKYIMHEDYKKKLNNIFNFFVKLPTIVSAEIWFKHYKSKVVYVTTRIDNLRELENKFVSEASKKLNLSEASKKLNLSETRILGFSEFLGWVKPPSTYVVSATKSHDRLLADMNLSGYSLAFMKGYYRFLISENPVSSELDLYIEKGLYHLTPENIDQVANEFVRVVKMIEEYIYLEKYKKEIPDLEIQIPTSVTFDIKYFSKGAMIPYTTLKFYTNEFKKMKNTLVQNFIKVFEQTEGLSKRKKSTSRKKRGA